MTRLVAEAHTKLQAGQIATELHFFISILGSNIVLDIKFKGEVKGEAGVHDSAGFYIMYISISYDTQLGLLFGINDDFYN